MVSLSRPKLVVELSVRVATEEGDPNLGQQLLADQVETALQRVGHLDLALLAERLDATATGKESKLDLLS